ncbi:MAG: SRPBCC family protein [Chloroflexota bacterium]
MYLENRITVNASMDSVFDLAVEIASWPDLLPHYRYVRIQRRIDDCTSEATMSARRTFVPVRWVSIQTIDRAAGQIRYLHTGGVTTGMDVVWTFQPDAERVHVTIVHQLRRPRSILRVPFAPLIADKLFISHIADRTLQGVKRQAEMQVSMREQA